MLKSVRANFRGAGFATAIATVLIACTTVSGCSEAPQKSSERTQSEPAPEAAPETAEPAKKQAREEAPAESAPSEPAPSETVVSEPAPEQPAPTDEAAAPEEPVIASPAPEAAAPDLGAAEPGAPPSIDQPAGGGQPRADLPDMGISGAGAAGGSASGAGATPPAGGASPSDAEGASGTPRELPRSRIGASRSLETGEPPVTAPPPVAPAPTDSDTATAAGTPPPPPADDKNFDVVPVYFGTDRKEQTDPKRLQYGAERAHKLQLGRALVTVPQAHKVPRIERPWVIELPYFKYKIYEQAEDPAKHFTLQEIKALSKDELLALVRERLAKSVNFKDSAIVFVHGFNTSFDNALYRTAQISYDLKFDGAPFLYSWPSGGQVASYTYDRGSAEQAEPHLAEFLNMVVKETGAKSISLIAHSMGNELLLRVLERTRPVVPDGVVISQVILAAPDVDRDKFANIARQITDFAKGVTLYAASNDRALGYSRRFWGGVPRAGDVPATGPLIISGVDTIDVTSVSTDGLGLNHSGYAENPALLDDVKALILQGVRPPDQRMKSILKVDGQDGVFWRFAPAP